MKSALIFAAAKLFGSLPVRGAWVEMTLDKRRKKWYRGRSPCGERGLKFLPGRHSRGQRGRSPCGERGLKSSFRRVARLDLGRSPCGERGLKFHYICDLGPTLEVAPRAGSVG